MSGQITTLDFAPNQKVRFVDEQFTLLLKDNRSILERLILNGRSMRPGTNQKYEWLEMQLSRTRYTVDGAIALNAAGTSTIVSFDTTEGMEKGMILSFKTAAGVDVAAANESPVVVIVDSVTNATNAVVYVMPGTVQTTLPDASIGSATRAYEENRKVFVGENGLPNTQAYNYFQKFETTLELSNDTINSLMYGDVNLVQNQLEGSMYQIMQQMKVAVGTGIRTERGSTLYGTTKSNGTLSSYQRYIDVPTGNQVDALNAALSQDLLNDAVQKIVENDGQFNSIICNYKMARQISALNTSGANPIVMLDRSNTTAGSFVQSFVSDIPVEGGLISTIIVDDSISNDKIFVVDINRIALVPYNNGALRIQEATTPGQDGVSYVLRGNYTLAVRDATKSHAVIKNIG